MKIVLISASTRPGRTSHRVALALHNYFSAQHEVALLDLKELDLPVFTERLQFLTEVPERIARASAVLRDAQALVFITPEYNGGIPSALKNFIDLFGRPEFAGKPIGVATASTGIMGGMRAAQQLQQTILAIQAYPQPQMLLTAEVTQQLDEEGQLINPAYQTKLESFAKALESFAHKLSATT